MWGISAEPSPLQNFLWDWRRPLLRRHQQLNVLRPPALFPLLQVDTTKGTLIHPNTSTLKPQSLGTREPGPKELLDPQPKLVSDT